MNEKYFNPNTSPVYSGGGGGGSGGGLWLAFLIVITGIALGRYFCG